MENFQVACVLLGLAFLAWRAYRAEAAAQRVLCVGLALLYATLIVLEVDLRHLDAPLLRKVWNGPIRNAGLVVAWLGGAWLFWRHAGVTWRYFRVWIWTGAGISQACAGLLWVCSGIIDKLHLFGTRRLFAEELLEVNAGLLMLLSAYLTFRSTGRNGLERPRARARLT